ncbi:MAG: multiple sugar transport system substrate-binding protein [Gaiellales bacterium]|nr:multiple sugar transport system substrate-binding protein [Gaiellales bacterium]
MRLLSRSSRVVGIVVAGLLVTACGGPAATAQPSTPLASTPQASAASAAPVSADLTFQFWIGGEADQKAWETVAGVAMADHPGLKITVQGTPWPDYWSKIGNQLSNAGAPCIVGMQSLRLAAYGDQLVPLDDLMVKYGVKAEDFDKSILDGTKHGGKQVALPYDFGPLVVYYNRDRFKAANIAEPKPGWTLDDFTKAATALTSGGKFGFTTASIDQEYVTWVLNLTGAEVLGADGKLALTSPAFVDGYKQYVALMRSGIAPPVSVAGYDGYLGMLSQWQDGSAAMYVDGPWMVISNRDAVKFDMGMAPMPAGPGGSKHYTAGSGFGISKQCATPDEAFQAIVSMTSDKALSGLASVGRAYPARPAVSDAWYTAAKIEGARETLEYAAAHSVPLLTPPNWVQAADVFDRFGLLALTGEATPEDTLKTVQDQGTAGN